MNSECYNLKRVVFVAVIVFLALWACRSTKQNLNKPPENPPAPPSPVIQLPFDVVESKVIEAVSPFDHNRNEHKTRTQDCVACHTRPTNESKPEWPVHAACNQCHGKDFPNTNSKMCVVCHKMPLDAPFSRINFPARMTQFGLKGFSHRTHADAEKMKGQMDPARMPEGAPRCDSCHRFDGAGLKASMPRHAECYSCHAHQPGEKFAACDVCHIKKPDAMVYSAALGTAFRLYNFRHGPHIKKAACEKCHQTIEVPAVQRRADVLQINVARGQRHHSTCWSCHVQARESVCSKCHVSSLPF